MSKLKQAREKAGLTQAELAEKVNIDNTYLSKIENGKARVNLPLAFRLGNVLDKSIYDIFEVMDLEPPAQKEGKEERA